MEDALGRQLREHGLTRVATSVLDQALDALRLVARPMDETTLAIGVSKIGGLPDLPPDVAWPGHVQRPHAFVAQFNLADIGGHARAEALPRDGLLSFFYHDHATDEDVGAGMRTVGREHRTGCTVFYFHDDRSALARRPAPSSLADWDRFMPCAIDAVPMRTLPAPESSAIVGLDLSEQERRAYIDFYLGLSGKYYDRRRARQHRLLGHPYNLERDARIASLLASRGQTWDDVDVDDPAVEADIEREAADWTLLLQLDSDEVAGMDWQGGGLIYFCLTRAALEAGDFSAVWATAQFL